MTIKNRIFRTRTKRFKLAEKGGNSAPQSVLTPDPKSNKLDDTFHHDAPVTGRPQRLRRKTFRDDSD
jgi:hypothetical protein